MTDAKSSTNASRTINADPPEHPNEILRQNPKGYMESLRNDQGLGGADQSAVIPVGEVLSPDDGFRAELNADLQAVVVSPAPVAFTIAEAPVARRVAPVETTITAESARATARVAGVPLDSLIKVKPNQEFRPRAEWIVETMTAADLKAVFQARIARFFGLANGQLVRQAIVQEGVQFTADARERNFSIDAIREAMS